MWDILKDWRGWLADWPLYLAGILGMAAMIFALYEGFAAGAAVAAVFLFVLLIYSIRKDASSGG